MPDEWKQTMLRNGEHCDHTFQQLTADYLERNIILVSALASDGHDERGEITIESNFKDVTKEPFYLLYFHFLPLSLSKSAPTCTDGPQPL